MTGTPDIRIGISGWTYTPWRGAFFPKGLRRKHELAYASREFRTIEINGTFYRLQKPTSFAHWASETPDDFVFTVKGSRFITHILRLRNPLVPLANFLASGVLELGVKLGPILWQFPPSFRFDAGLMRAFLALLPYDTDAARNLAEAHDARVKNHVAPGPNGNRTLRHAIEIRHESFVDPAFIALLREFGVASVCADTVKWPRLMDVTADFVYCRLHGSRELYRSGYTEADLDVWAERVRRWSHGLPAEGDNASPLRMRKQPRDVFVFFDNTDKLHAPDNARGLMRRLGQPVPPGS